MSACPESPYPIAPSKACTLRRFSLYFSGDLGHRNTAGTSRTAWYLHSVTLSFHGMSESVKHQAEPMCQASSGTAHRVGHRVGHRPVRTFSTSSRAHFGAPRLRPEPATRTGASNRESKAAGWPVTSGKGRRGSRRCGGGSFRRALRAEALRRDELPRTAAPAPAAAGPRRHAPMPHHTSRARPSRADCAHRRAKGHSHRAGTPRIIRVGPSSVKGTRRSFLTASQKRFSGPALERRSLCRPSGPDGEGQARGQARNARGGLYRDFLLICSEFR